MKTEYTYAGTTNINGIAVTKMRGSRLGQTMRDKTKYCRKAKHKGRT